MSKPTLQEVVNRGLLYTAKECLDHLGWTYQETEEGFENIHCSCGATTRGDGWFGTNYMYCPDCEKGMADMTAILPGGNSWVTVIDPDKVEVPADGRIWLPERVWGPRPTKEPVE